MNRLKELRLERGLTLNDISRDLQIPLNTLSNYERGDREPKLETWEKLAQYFNVTPQYLVGWADE